MKSDAWTDSMRDFLKKDKMEPALRDVNVL